MAQEDSKKTASRISDSIPPPPQLEAQSLNSEMAKAFQELARGETTAAALETKLDGIESRIDELLASVEATLPKELASDTSKSNN
ncbi:hypothetical protein B0A52_08782 [Exophiala mesophila]|uniref:Uncharacterized protein n=1 Tax=Exophiala mesophila TaxID=212818 RepID=A0A438MUN6_EXOME|nr:hypothetical protein B0A52_08782 [Exophiala mesophila]